MYRKRVILFVVSILLLASLFYTIDYNEFFRVASKLSLHWIAYLLLLQAAILFLTALKWYVIIKRYAVSFWHVFNASLISQLVSNVTPMNLAGGEIIRAYAISKIDRIKMEAALATVIVDLFVTILPLLFLDLVSIILIFKYNFDLRIAWILGIVGVVILALMAASMGIVMRRGPSLMLFNRLLDLFGRVGFLRRHVKKIESRVDELFSSFHHSIRTTMTDLPTLTSGTLISASIWVSSILRLYLIFMALGVPVKFDEVVIVYTVLIMVSIFSLLPGALGIWEWVGSGMFALFGIPLEAAAAAVIIDRILFYWIPMFTGFLASLHVGLNIMKLVDKD